MATLASLVLDVEDMLYGMAQMERPSEDLISTEVADENDVAWRFTTLAYAKRGNYMEVYTADGAEGEIVILAADQTATGSDVAVRRAQQQTTAAATTIAAGSVARVNPTFPVVRIKRFINEVIDNHLWPDVWYRTNRSVDPNTGRRLYPLNASDFQVEEMYQIDTASEAAIGTTWTFDFTGGASEDLWTTAAAHGLAVGDPVRFTTAGTGADEYAADTVYWVATAPSTTTVQLSATESTTVLAGTADSIGTWVAEKVVFSRDPFPDGWFEMVTDTDTTKSGSTARNVRIYNRYSDDDLIYYITRTKPDSSAVASLPAPVAALVPYGAAWLLLSGTRTIPTRIDPRRNPAISSEVIPSQVLADARFFENTFKAMKRTVKRQLQKEKQPRTRIKRPFAVRRG